MAIDWIERDNLSASSIDWLQICPRWKQNCSYFWKNTCQGVFSLMRSTALFGIWLPPLLSHLIWRWLTIQIIKCIEHDYLITLKLTVVSSTFRLKKNEILKGRTELIWFHENEHAQWPHHNQLLFYFVIFFSI